MRKVVFRSGFENDVRAAAEWYESERQGLGAEFLEELDRMVLRLCGNPESFPLMDEVVRVAVLRRLLYGIYFRVTQDEIVITSVIHLHRDDKAWKSRT